MSLAYRRGTLVGNQDGAPTLAPGKGIRRSASNADRCAFEAALRGSEVPVMGHLMADSAACPASCPAVDAGFPSAAQDPPSQGGRAPDLAFPLGQFVKRLLVGHDAAGRRQVRIDLKDPVLSGVSLAIFEEEGRLVVVLLYTAPSSGTRLAACAQALARELAESLSRPTLLRVTAGNAGGERPLEVTADPCGPGVAIHAGGGNGRPMSASR